MKFRTILIGAASALAFISTGALAQSNETYLDQNGANNNALVEQSGGLNRAGSATLNMTQEDFQNDLNILQSGLGGSIGLEGAGVFQKSNRTKPGDIGNAMTIDQGGAGNTVGSASQFTFGTNTISGVNSVDITQTGALNRVGTIEQRRGSSTTNRLTVTQSDGGNRLENVYQRGAMGGNQTNAITVTMSGAGNGLENSLQLFAAIPGVAGSTLRQGYFTDQTRGNTIVLDVSGIGNDFGITQDGLDNTVGTVTITDLDNQVGIRQQGNRNMVGLSTVSGIGNNIGIQQFMNDNMASVTVSGNLNRMGVYQDGDLNTADVVIDGNNNGLAYNSFLGFPTTPRGYTGDAATVLGVSLGEVRQIGDTNTASLTITGNDNLFGTLQQGADNNLTGTVTGNSNQVAVAQLGNTNTSVFTQTGNSNNAAISQ